MKNNRTGLSASVMGTAAAVLFVAAAVTAAIGFRPFGGLSIGKETIQALGLWTIQHYGLNIFQISLILAGVCAAGLSPLCFFPKFEGKRSTAAGMVFLVSMALTALLLLLNGFFYKQFYVYLRYLNISKACHILIGAAFAISLGASAVFCCFESGNAFLTDKFRFGTMRASAILLGSAALLFALSGAMAMEASPMGSERVLGNLVLPGISLLAFAVSQLISCLKSRRAAL